MEFYSPFQGISLVYQQKIVNIKTLFILNNAFEEKYQFQLFFLNSFFFHLKLSHSQPNRKSLAIDKNKKNSKYVWKFSWMLNHVELNAVLSETLVYAYFVLMGLD